MKILNSPLKADKIKSSDNFSNIRIFKQRIYYSTNSKDNKGLTVISSNLDGSNKSYELPHNIYMSTKINVYGGICFCPTAFGLVFSDSTTGELCIVQDDKVKSLTHNSGYHYGDISYSDGDILFVAEQSTGGLAQQHIGKINLSTNEYCIIAKGSDFYHCPQSQGSKTIWLQWSLPYMPWDNSSVVLLEQGKQTIVSTGVGHFQPTLYNGDIYYAKDTGNYFNIFKNNQNICKCSIDFYMPLWVYGMSTYTVLNDKIIAVGAKNGDWCIGELSQNSFKQIPSDYVYFDGLSGSDNNFGFIGRKTDNPSEIIVYKNSTKHIVDTGDNLTLSPCYISTAKTINFKNPNGDPVYGYYYAPSNPSYNDNLPPLIVKSHSGPTGQATTYYNPKIQFWTSRGFAVLDVNYSGSSGFGTQYRNRLNGLWGDIDVRELELGAKYCIENNLANPDELIVSGSSAGGYSVLCALAFGNVFSAGTCVYGIGDLYSLVNETHKFEANYFDVLIAPYNEANKALYQSRSPINSADKITAPVLFLQGLDDVVVPPKQAKLMYNCLLQNKVPTALINYVGEGHGFRNHETKAHTLIAELQFYDYVFNKTEPDYKINFITELDFKK